MNEVFFAPSVTTRSVTQTTLAHSTRPRLPDYLPNSLQTSRNTRKIRSRSERLVYFEDFTGSIELTSDIGQRNIVAASLSLTYWPDRSLPDSYAEILVEETNS
ncbi:MULTISPECIES: hypothetical protein [unclassified Pseudomonas]|uniref:hypothetical protein n=1 Tax=unclassified Pseudomonas TaxID=196821 RepID=UPI00382ADABF